MTKATQEEAFNRLVEIIKVLRKECPWDKVQTHESLKKCLIEEAYETVDAIDNKDTENLREELGDVILQVVFHGLLSEEEGHFNLTDVINQECEKMIYRHPHIFSSEEAKTVDKVLEKWENMKSIEHKQERYTDRLESVPKALPALMRSCKVQRKAAGVGFDWDETEGALDKLNEEMGELVEACSLGQREEIEDEFGDLLFSMVNLSRFINVDAEEALNKATQKFISRFDAMENIAEEGNMDISDLTLEEMDILWERAKNRLK